MTGMKNRVARFERALEFLAIAGAREGAERHTLIRQLPVQVVETAAKDGREGTYKQFIAGGKTRIIVFTPHEASPPPLVELRAEQPVERGPAVPEHAAKEDCYFEGEWGPCATEQEAEDALILGAALEVEHEQAEAELQQVQFEHEEYCRNYPWECSQDELPIASGPHCGTDGASRANCFFEITGAAWGLLSAAAARYDFIQGARQYSALAITGAALSFKAVLAVGGAAFAIVGVAGAFNCVRTWIYEPEVALSSGATSSSTVANWLAARVATKRSFVLFD